MKNIDETNVWKNMHLSSDAWTIEFWLMGYGITPQHYVEQLPMSTGWTHIPISRTTDAVRLYVDGQYLGELRQTTYDAYQGYRYYHGYTGYSGYHRYEGRYQII